MIGINLHHNTFDLGFRGQGLETPRPLWSVPDLQTLPGYRYRRLLATRTLPPMNIWGSNG